MNFILYFNTEFYFLINNVELFSSEVEYLFKANVELEILSFKFSCEDKAEEIIGCSALYYCKWFKIKFTEKLGDT